MKRFLIVASMTCVLSAAVLAQDETLIGGQIQSGGYGGPMVSFSRINGQNSVFVGGKGGWIINHSFVLGGGGYGLVTDVTAKTASPLGEKYIDAGYGGVILEYISDSHKLIHFSAGLLIGGGGISYRARESMDSHRTGDAFFVAEPGVYVDLNVTTYFRLSVGAQYRLVSGVDTPVDSAGVKIPLTSDVDMSGPSAVLTLRFGSF